MNINLLVIKMSQSSTVEPALDGQAKRRRKMREGKPAGNERKSWVHSEHNPIGVLQINVTQPL